MRIVFITPYHHQEGLSEYSRLLTAELKKLAEIKVFSMPASRPQSLLDFVNAVNKDKFSLVHIQHELACWGSFTNPFTSRFFEFCEKIKIPKVVTFHSVDLKGETWRKWGPWGKYRFVKMHNLPQASIVHSDYLRRGLVDLGVKAKKLHVIPIGIPKLDSWMIGELDSGKGELKLEGRRVVSVFGFINPDKGYEIVLEALRDLPKDVVFVIAGGVQDQSNQAYLRSLKSLIAQMGLQERVVITGFLEKPVMLALMQQTEIVLFPRTHVNASLELSLAIALKKPILASDLPYFVEVRERVPCLEVFELEGDQVANFKKRLLELLGDKSRQYELSQECAVYAEKHLWQEIARRTVSVYGSVL